ncbi:hypothetical protein [Haliovirga abyssi]|uniref:Energy-coupling factor transporter transmembrane protein EcfT n=1 Tax=Haliovirga abyssi TaxID=2996794 RepID=A0AAU9DD51_9FUSO|nr:hypothetical protein [Haliovirga abyssi]BDU50237.1 hypothetical protein HLVA_08060 [Haliovirga abyssi]
MLLSKLILILVVLISYNIKIVLSIFIISFILFMYKHKKIDKNIKYFIWFLIISFSMQLLYSSEGKVLFKIYKILITDIGITNGIVVVLKILTVWLISATINYEKIKFKRLKKYEVIVRKTMKLVPEVFKIAKTDLKPKTVFKKLLYKVYREL